MHRCEQPSSTDRARSHMRQKAGGDWARATLTSNAKGMPEIASAEQAIALDEALTRLS
jgi:hypothetical protein